MPSTLVRMSATLWHDLLSRLASPKPGRRASDIEPDVVGEPGVRLIDGELRYSDLWLDEDADEPGDASHDADDAEP